MLIMAKSWSRRTFRSPLWLRAAWVNVFGLALSALLGGSPTIAHDGHPHAKTKGTAKVSADNGAAKAAALPLGAELFLGGKIGGDFILTDQHGKLRNRRDFAGRHVLLFFGYAQCESICSAAIPLMSQAVDRLGDKGKAIDLVLITVDPDRDTPEGLRTGLKKYDPRFIGLTGTKDVLEPVWKAFQISTKEVARDWLDQPILAHGSFIYLLGPQGEVQTLLPPILSPDQMSKIISSYLH